MALDIVFDLVMPRLFGDVTADEKKKEIVSKSVLVLKFRFSEKVTKIEVMFPFFLENKVKNILKGRLDLISSTLPSVIIQIMGGKVCLRCKLLLGDFYNLK